MRIGRNQQIQADLPSDPTWDNWRRWVNKKEKGNLTMRVSIGPKGM